jgi:8-oxo-dGTP diphosphatase
MAGQQEHGWREWREWRVAGALIEQDGLLLLVANRRRGGQLEWTPPGGVIDPGETSTGALTREVREETGLIVESWTSTVYEVSVDFPDRGMRLGVEVFVAESWHGSMVFEDPDGIVEEGRFVDLGESAALLVSAPTWVREPVGAWLGGAIEPGARFEYMAKGTRPGNMTVERR